MKYVIQYDDSMLIYKLYRPQGPDSWHFQGFQAAAQLLQAAIKGVAQDAGTLIQQPIVATRPGDLMTGGSGFNGIYIKDLMGFVRVYIYISLYYIWDLDEIYPTTIE